LVAIGWPTRIISVTTRDMPDYGPHHLRICVDDIIRPSPGLILPLQSHLVQVLDFTEGLGWDDHILVHCVSGINRSTAMAIGILIQHGVVYTEACRQVATQRPHLAPNRLIISYVDQHFGLGGKLSRLVVHPIGCR